MTQKVAKKIVRGIKDKIECNTVDIDDWAEFWGFTREEYEDFLDMALKVSQTKPCKAQPKSSNSEKPNKWNKEPPKKDGKYLVWLCNRVEIAGYANNLYKLDKYDFEGKKRAGWYIYDGEYGYCELEDVLGWLELPSGYKEGEGEE